MNRADKKIRVGLGLESAAIDKLFEPTMSFGVPPRDTIPVPTHKPGDSCASSYKCHIQGGTIIEMAET